MNRYVVLDRTPELAHPAMICAFNGWNDGGEAATAAAGYLMEQWGAEVFGRIDGEEFYDFQVNRPTVHLEGGVSRVVEWPTASLAAASPPGRDVVFFTAPEPNVRWGTFIQAVLDVAIEIGADLLVTLGGFLTDVPYLLDVPVVGSARDDDEASRLDLSHSQYEGPTGIVGVLHDAANRAGVPSVSLWAAVPHYLPVAPNPKAALALVQRASSLLDVPVDEAGLVTAAARWERGAARLIEDNEELAEYVGRLQEAAAEAEAEKRSPMREEPIPSGDALAAEFERFLREQSGPGRGEEGSTTG